MEFVIVTFPRIRGLKIDGAPQGQTGQLIGVQRGHHIFDLGDPKNYVPVGVSAFVLGTTQTRPMVIPFQPAMRSAQGATGAATRRARGVAAATRKPREATAAKPIVRVKSAKKRARVPVKKKPAKAGRGAKNVRALKKGASKGASKGRRAKKKG